MAIDAGFVDFASCNSDKQTGLVTMGMKPLIYLIDKIDHPNGDSSTYSQLNHLFSSPRELVRFFHRRSACSCLEDLYYNLKDNTSKKTYCHGSKETSNLRDVFKCECKLRLYCSCECAKKVGRVIKFNARQRK
jgi:hypothetical protein